ncbi:MAG: hypothetical protein VB141_12475, partial [Burkholderia gladioli]
CFIISAPDHVSCFDSASPNLFSHSLAPILATGTGRPESLAAVIPRAAIEPLMQTKTRGELVEKLNALLEPFGIAVATE